MIELSKLSSLLRSGINSEDPDQSEKAQKIVKLALTGVVTIGAAAFMLAGGSSQNNQKTIKDDDLPQIYTDDKTAQTRYVGAVAPEVASVVQKNEELMKTNQDLAAKIKEIDAQIKATGPSSSPSSFGLQELPTAKTPMPSSGVQKGIDAAQMMGLTPGQVPAPQSVTPIPLPQNRIVTKADVIKDALAIDAVQQPQQADSKKKSDETLSTKGMNAQKPYIPTGAITKAYLLNGLFAPTMSKAKSTPIPALMRLSDLSIIPNRQQFNIKDCFVLGEGYGELSSERVHIRLTALSCVTADRKVIDTDLKGFVTDGTDGATGISGTVVSKQGALLARTIIAGFFEGVGKAFSQANTSVLTSALGTTMAQTSTDPNTVMRAGAYGGASKAAEKLADFYLKMADSIEPVLEVKGGRKVEIVITQGKALTKKNGDENSSREISTNHPSDATQQNSAQTQGLK